MYTPEQFQEKNRAEVEALIHRYPLATVISVIEGMPMVSHLPLVLKDGVLYGHMAKANPHWRHLGEVTAIFHGPDAYITPNWYPEPDVPTWNYAVVHAHGIGRLIEEREGILSCLRLLTDKMGEWEFYLPEEDLVRAIVGFEIQIAHVDAKFKLSQHRGREEKTRVIAGLREERGDTRSRELAELIEARLNVARMPGRKR